MLNQLRSAVNVAQAIQADVDRIIAEAQPKPKRVRPYRTYTFTESRMGGLRMVVISDTGRSRITDLSAREYDRFVRIANSGNYAVTLEDSDYGVAWTLRRKSA